VSTKQTALASGRRRYQRQQRREAIARVRAYQKWLRDGSSFRTIGRLGKLPTDNDYEVARRAGAIR
jgi:hypothetical protein